MTAKEKASQLTYDIFNFTDHMQFIEAKELALLMTDETITALESLFNRDISKEKYYKNIQSEIKKLTFNPFPGIVNRD